MLTRNALQIHLGEKFNQLDQVVKNAHIGTVHLRGHIAVVRGNMFANILCNLLGMPADGSRVLNTVIGHHYPETMYWERTFNGHAFNSRFTLKGRHLMESIGPLRLFLFGEVEEGALVYQLSHVKIFGISLPKFIAPSLHASERECSGKYQFCIKTSLPFIGLLIQYAGVIDLVDKP